MLLLALWGPVDGHTAHNEQQRDADENQRRHRVEVLPVEDTKVPDGREQQPEQREHQRPHVEFLALQREVKQ